MAEGSSSAQKSVFKDSPLFFLMHAVELFYKCNIALVALQYLLYIGISAVGNEYTAISQCFECDVAHVLFICFS